MSRRSLVPGNRDRKLGLRLRAGRNQKEHKKQWAGGVKERVHDPVPSLLPPGTPALFKSIRRGARVLYPECVGNRLDLPEKFAFVELGRENHPVEHVDAPLLLVVKRVVDHRPTHGVSGHVAPD